MNTLTMIKNYSTIIKKEDNKSFIIISDDKVFNLDIELLEEKIDIKICYKNQKIKWPYIMSYQFIGMYISSF